MFCMLILADMRLTTSCCSWDSVFLCFPAKLDLQTEILDISGSIQSGAGRRNAPLSFLFSLQLFNPWTPGGFQYHQEVKAVTVRASSSVQQRRFHDSVPRQPWEVCAAESRSTRQWRRMRLFSMFLGYPWIPIVTSWPLVDLEGYLVYC